MTDPLKIGISACFFHADAERPIFKGKTLQYIEQSMAHWVASGGDTLPVMVPSPLGDTSRGTVGFDDYARWLDGLVLMGGSDMWPGHYGEAPLQPQWAGDRVRDEYETALARAFVAQGKPVFGVCRGLQVLNVAFGGSLLQDIATLKPRALPHRKADLYDRNFHAVELVPGSRLAQLYPGVSRATVNSVHHQGIARLADQFVVEALCPDDEMIEAVRWTGPGYVAAVQWHPEFHRSGDGVIDDAPMLRDFLQAARAARRR
ncbi:MAG: gamma-glutamyl-gamma-aminobutyrate hydrolase family protein [Ideonella sp.]|nr:gamma-glutamyl-gamma-aminobutyrate hydrolase family protein [Ideonella sp.]MCC7458789.1 gamma-glutamyl-gamma-aminobutyrate hydrolase family protein [Nitrospira sp.]